MIPDKEAGDTPSPDFAKVGKNAAIGDFQAAAADGWEYDSDAMRAQINHLEDVYNGRLQKMNRFKEDLVTIDPPGGEVVSERYTNIANFAGESHNTQFGGYRKYLQAYIEALREIDRAYTQQDQAAVDALRGMDV